MRANPPAKAAPGRANWPRSGPFSLADEGAYRAWRAQKLAAYPQSLAQCLVAVADPDSPDAATRAAVRGACARANFAIYDFGAPGRDERDVRARLKRFGAAFGLVAVEDHRSAEADGIVRIEIANAGGRAGYIPYSNRPIAWHTDGYYNYHAPDRAIHAMLLHCVRGAAEGGVNRLLDHEIAFLRLRDADPRFVAALAHPAAMTIPESVEADGRVRAANAGPVFFIEPRSDALAMRYTARTRSIIWRDDAATREAAAALNEILANEPLTLEGRLAPGQGVICNNVLHDRSGFAESAPEGAGRLLMRIRYAERVGGDDRIASQGGMGWRE